MKEADYIALTAACDKLLREPGTTADRMAVSSLHVLSEHPNNYWQYEGVFERARPASVIRRRLRDSAGIARTLGWALLRPGAHPDAACAEYSGVVDILFISHLVSAAQGSSASTDFYYGDLAQELADRGISSVTLLLNHTSCQVPSRGYVVAPRPFVGRVVLPLWLTFGEEAHMLRRARSVASGLFHAAAGARNAFERAVASQAGLSATSGRTITSLRLHSVVKRLCARFKPRAVIVTWEGHAWERLAFHAARTVFPAVRCIAYQHAIIFPRSHALKRSLGPLYDPDVVLTVGDVNRDVLSTSDGLRGVPIITYGSHRRAAMPKLQARTVSGRCLVVPEGFESECLTLFDFAVRAAAHLPHVEFLLRTHPVFPYSSLVLRHSRFRTLPANVRVSDEYDISADFARCDWALYRGSSAAVYAVLAGVRPLYVDCPGELSIDPLFALRDWRRRVSSVDALGRLIEADRVLEADARRNEWEPARAFCDRYVVPPNSEVVRALLCH